MTTIPLPVLVSMLEMNSDLFPFALLFRDYAIADSGKIDWHRKMIAKHSRITKKTINGLLVTQYLFRNTLHRNSLSPSGPGPAYIQNRPDGILYIWFQNGRRHRKYGAAYIFIGFVNNDYQFGWWRYGWRYRENDLPTFTIISSDGSVINKYYNTDNQLHRNGGPAYEHDEVQHWKINGELHRTDGPAIIHPNKNAWYYKNRLHRLDGPAVTIFNKQGKVIFEGWYNHGVFGQPDNGRSELLAMTCWDHSMLLDKFFPKDYLTALPTPFQVWSRGSTIKAILYL